MSNQGVGDLRILLGVSMVLALGVIYSPWLLLVNRRKLSGKELGQAHPRFSWMRLGFLLLNAGWVLLTLCLLMAISTQIGEQAMYLYGVWLVSVGLFNGIFAVYTRVCPVPFPTHYVYVYGDKARQAGKVQAGLAFVYIVVAIGASVIS
jgi:hypothetical protein